MTSQSVNHCLIHPSLKVPKSNTKPQIKIICNIVPGKVSEHQKKLWWALWRKLAAQAKDETVK